MPRPQRKRLNAASRYVAYSLRRLLGVNDMRYLDTKRSKVRVTSRQGNRATNSYLFEYTSLFSSDVTVFNSRFIFLCLCMIQYLKREILKDRILSSSRVNFTSSTQNLYKCSV